VTQIPNPKSQIPKETGGQGDKETRREIPSPKSQIPNYLRLSAFICVLILFLAFALRIHHLDGQSLWNDEGLSLHRASLPLAAIASNVITVDGFETTDTNPPFYFFLLHFWRAAAGESIFALRYLGVLLGLLAVPLIYRLGRLTVGRTSALVAAGLLALSPFHVWQSQEMRNYTLLLTLNLLSVYALFRFLLSMHTPFLRSSASSDAGRVASEDATSSSRVVVAAATPSSRVASEDATSSLGRQWGWLVVSLTAALLAIYTHYFGFFVFAFMLLCLGAFALGRHWWRRRWLWVGLAVAAVALLPIIPVALARFQAGQQSGFDYVPPLHILSHALSAYSVGFRPTVVQPLWRVGPVVALALIGLTMGLASGRPRRQLATLLLLGYLVVPLVLLVGLSAVNPLYNGPRHLLMGLPPFLLLVASSVGRFGKSPSSVRKPYGGRIANSPYEKKELRGTQGNSGNSRIVYILPLVAALLFSVGSQVGWLNTQFTAPELIKDDLRGAAEWLNGAAGPNDVVILHDALIRFAFDAYYDGRAPLLAIPRFASGDEEAAVAALEAAGETAERVWFVTLPEPRDGFPVEVLPRWASRHWVRLLSRAYPHIWLSVNVDVYAPRPVAAPAATAEPIMVWDNGLGLLAADVPTTAVAGEVWWPRFEWQLPTEAAVGYSLSLRLLDDAGEVWLQSDEPLWPALWSPEAAAEPVRLDHPITLPAGLPPGLYRVWLRLLQDGQPIASIGGEIDAELVETLLVQAASGRAAMTRLPEHTPLAVQFGRDLELIGYHLPAGSYQPGHLLLFDLYWRGRRTPSADYRLRLELLDPAGQPIAENIVALTRADYPPTRWQPGEILRTQAYLVVPANVTAGSHPIHVSLLPPDSDEPIPARSGGQLWGQESLALAAADIVAPPIQTELPAIEILLRADFGEPAAIELHGYQLEGVPQPGETLTLTLIWRGSAPMEVNYTVFVHLADGSNELAGQGDGQPDRGFRPTNSWRSGEVIVDEHSLTIRPDAPGGRYQLWLGFYHPETGQRLPVFVEGVRQPDDRLLLQEVVLP
jgi:4-amino-4-deoxy-L-arabinose transferase-like glycosyltransferase